MKAINKLAIKALKKYIICEDLPDEMVTDAGLVLTNQERQGFPRQAKVLASPEGSGLNVGDILLYAGLVQAFRLSLDDHLLALEDKDVICVLDASKEQYIETRVHTVQLELGL